MTVIAPDVAAACFAEAREHAYDEWIASLYAPEPARAGLQALAAFAASTQHAALSAHEPRAGAIRVAWWREALAGERPGELAANPIAAALHAATRDLAGAGALLELMLDARLIELEHERLADDAALQAYANLAEGAKFRLSALLATGRERPEVAAAAERAGVATTIVKLLSANDSSLLPTADTLATDADEPLRATLVLAERAADRARPLVKALPRAERVAFLPLAAIGADLASFRAVKSGDLTGASRLRRQWAMWWAR